jgi:hypothetical protein
MRCSHLFVALLLSLPASALAAGPVVSVGGLMTDLPLQGGDECFRGMSGGSYKLGFEVGQRFRSEWSFSQSMLGSSSDAGKRSLSLNGMGYQLAFHLRPRGFSPYMGLGVEMGVAILESSRYATDEWDFGHAGVDEGPYLRAHAVLGLRYQMESGLGFRAELARSTYGDFYTTSTNLGATFAF